jgi:hypothetical protein
MALTGAELTDEVQVLVGRSSSDPLVDNTRVTRWLSEGQRDIVERCPGLHALSFKNTDSLDTTQSLRYNMSDITVRDPTTANNICHLFDVWYLDGNESLRLIYTMVDDFDDEWPDPTHSDMDFQRPNRWTRRGNVIEIVPLSACAYVDKDLRIDGDFYPADFTTESTEVSDISRADEGLIYYAVWKAWGAIGGKAGSLEELKYKSKYENWRQEYQEQNDSMYEWDGKLFGNIDGNYR